MPAPAGDAGVTETVASYLGLDHARIGRCLDEASAAVEEGRFAAAEGAFARFKGALGRHERIEEEIVFPVFEARSGVVGGPLALMHEEHRLLRRAVERMGRAVARRDASAWGEGLDFLRSVLADHNAREERILYPAVDALLTEAERATLVARLRRE